MAVQLSNVSSTLLPPTITGPIFAKASETSAVMQLARRVELGITANTAIPVSLDVPVAGWVSEGAAKPVSDGAVGVKLMTPKKVAMLVPLSEELVRSNAAGLYDQLVQDLPTAIARAFDQAAINGKDLRTGNAGPFADYLSQTPNTVALGTAASNAGGIYTDLANGVGKVVDKNYDFNGFAIDPRMRVDAMLSTDSIGRPLFVGQDNPPTIEAVGSGRGTLAGLPAYVSQGVSGRYWRQGDKVQTVTINGTPTGGTFNLSAGGNTATGIAYNAAASTVQTAIRAFGGYFSGVTVTGSAGGPYTVTFPDVGSNEQSAAAPVTIDQRNLTGGTAATSAATVTPSGPGGSDTNLRAVGGDWSQCAYGVGMGITIRTSTDATYSPDGGTTWVSAFQNNLVLLLVEAYFGFVVANVNAFVTYTKGSAAF